MHTASGKHTYAVEQRLRLIDFLLAQYGQINRAALTDFFGISDTQASLDIKEYMALAPANLAYQVNAKAYKRTDKFTRVFP
jgi:hypothetical protein